jgi:predicted Ser/Thr protein kinase
MGSLTRDVGDAIGGYVVLEVLGRGGSGAVYKVRADDGGVAALKLVDAREDDVALQRLAREVHALQTVRHPAIPEILDAEVDGGDNFVVFEFIPGVSLFDHVQRNGALRGEELAALAERLASALEAAHAAGVVHRDVTPANVMMGDHGPMLIDFGLAHRTEDSRLTRDGLVSGTAGYVAPEVIDGEEPGAIADRWSWAATVAFAMTGTAPFGFGTGAISRTLEANPVLPDVPGAAELRAALQRDARRRPGMRDVVAALRGATEVLDTRTADADGVGATAVLPLSHGAQVTWENPDADHLEDDRFHDDDGDLRADSFDEGPSSGEVRAARGPRRPLVIFTAVLALAAGAALAPVLSFFAMATLAAIARTVYRRALALAMARSRRGARRGDSFVYTMATPWHFLRATVEALPAALVSASVGAGTAALGWWLVSNGTVAPLESASQTYGHAIALSVGALAAAAMLWWGPWMDGTREGAHRLAYGLAPTRGVAAMWVVVSLTAIAAVGIAVYLEVDPWWWPLPPLPTETVVPNT